MSGSSLQNPPANFIAYNNQLSKQLIMVVDIEGLPIISNLQVGRTVNYGDNIVYGQPGLLYGSLVPVGFASGERQQLNLLQLDGLTISQQLEPEQGRGSISTLNLNFVDKNGVMTQYISPGVVIPDILGQQVKIWIGYAPTSWPADYYVVWRGRVGQVNASVGKISMQLVDPNVVRRSQILYGGSSTLLGNIPATTTTFTATYDRSAETWTAAAHGHSNGDIITLTSTISLPTGYAAATPYYIISATVNTFQLSTSPTGFPVVAITDNGSGVITCTSDASIVQVVQNNTFFEKILAPNGSYDQSVRTFLKIDDEFIEYQQNGSESIGFGVNDFTNIVRGANPLIATNMPTLSAPAVHSSGTTVDNYIMIIDHALIIALKLMLSGWDGPYLTGQSIYSLLTTDDSLLPTVTNGIVLPINVDAIRDLGITAGDYITISGDSHGGNNVTCTVLGFNDLSGGQTNRVILTSVNFTASDPSSAKIAVRSQYDTYPTLAGCALPGWEVDVGTFLTYYNTYLQGTAYTLHFLLTGPETGKTFIESELLLPFGAYSLTRQGKISMGLTKPPIAGQTVQTLNISNVIEPQNIMIGRGINNRKYFNEIDWSYDCDDTNSATALRNTINASSLATIGVLSVLPITSRGARTYLGFNTTIVSRENAIFSRYANASVILDIKVNLSIGTLIEAGDIVIVYDNGQLQIPNFSNGTRNLGIQLMEVINRSLDFKNGTCILKLEGGTGATITDRYATISPSSLVIAGSTSSRVLITESFGSYFPGQEYRKWQPYIGLNIWVHSVDFGVSGTSTLIGLDPNNNNALLLSPALSFVPLTNYIVDLVQYPAYPDVNANDQALAKTIHAYLSPNVAIVSGTSTTFTVGGGDIFKFNVGMPVLIHDPGWTRSSGLTPGLTITKIVSNTVTVSAVIGSGVDAIGGPFAPDASCVVELIGFADLGQPYRLI